MSSNALERLNVRAEFSFSMKDVANLWSDSPKTCKNSCAERKSGGSNSESREQGGNPRGPSRAVTGRHREKLSRRQKSSP